MDRALTKQNKLFRFEVWKPNHREWPALKEIDEIPAENLIKLDIQLIFHTSLFI